jgi:hypothetical protein
MLPFHRKEKLDKVKQYPFPYRFVKPAMFVRTRRRFTFRQIHISGFFIIAFLLWLMFRGGDRASRNKSPYAIASKHTDDTLPIVDVTIQECTRWRWFEKRSKCTALLNDGWEISGGDLLLNMGSNRVHLFIKRHTLGERKPPVTQLRVSKNRLNKAWESRPGGIWIQRSVVIDIKEAITSIDFIHGKDIRELRRGRQFVPGGPLILGEYINLSYRMGLPPPREFPILKVKAGKPYKVLQVAGSDFSKLSLIVDLHLSTGATRCRDVVSQKHKLTCEADTASLDFLEYIIDNEKPDFIAFTGDQVNGDSAPNTKSVFNFWKNGK